MAAEADLGDLDDGMVGVTILGTKLMLDLWDVNNRLVAIHEKHKGTPGAYLPDVAAFVQSLGFPAVSQRLAERFAAQIWAWTFDAKKKDAAELESRVSTASTPSA